MIWRAECVISVTLEVHAVAFHALSVREMAKLYEYDETKSVCRMDGIVRFLGVGAVTAGLDGLNRRNRPMDTELLGVSPLDSERNLEWNR